VLGGQANPYETKGQWRISANYRWQKSDRHFRGIHEEPIRQQEGSEVINRVHLFDLATTYALSDRTTISLSLPFVLADRSQAIRDSNRVVIGRFSTQASGLGDISLVGRRWMFDTTKHLNQNLSLGLGIKIPTGDYDVTDTFVTNASGSTAIRTVDQSIQPGDGGWGAILDVQGFRAIGSKMTMHAAGTYLFNPRETNGVPTFRGRASEAVMSVADQYLVRVGASAPLSRQGGLAGSLSARIEGVPPHDVFGSSNGFRRPGYALSIEPGVVISRGKSTVSFSIPIAWKRNRQPSVPDNIDDTIGDAAFADYVVLTGYTYTF
jgi:hypothetical protein